ncbi:MAG: stage III sporulation protein AE [Firmicutes bacterium]|nr:stage III sporulation protein AE [Bacillota bacterium]
MRRALTLALVLVIIILAPVPAFADADEDEMLMEMERQWQTAYAQYERYLPELDWRTPGARFDILGLISGLLTFLFHEIWVNGVLLGQLLLLAVLAAVLNRLQAAFGNDGVARVGRAVVFLVLFSVSVHSFTVASGMVREVVGAMSDFTMALVPVLLALLAGMGSLAAAAVFQPLLFTAAAVIGFIISNVIMPLLFLAMVLALVDKMMSGLGLQRLAGFLKDGAVWILGLLLTLFVGVTVINGTVATIADGVALRTGKFAAKAAVPVVGGMFADAFETVAGASLVLKNSVGVFGLVMLTVICVFPILKLFVITVIYRLTAALIQPLGEDGISGTLDTMAGFLFVLIGTLTAAALMFFFVVTILVASANLMVMVR